MLVLYILGKVHMSVCIAMAVCGYEVCMCVFVYMYIHESLCNVFMVHMSVLMSAFVCLCVCKYEWVHVSVCQCGSMCMCVNRTVYICVCVFAYISSCMCAHVYLFLSVYLFFANHSVAGGPSAPPLNGDLCSMRNVPAHEIHRFIHVLKARISYRQSSISISHKQALIGID